MAIDMIIPRLTLAPFAPAVGLVVVVRSMSDVSPYDLPTHIDEDFVDI